MDSCNFRLHLAWPGVARLTHGRGNPRRASRSILSRRVRLDTSFTSGHISVRPRLSIAMSHRMRAHLSSIGCMWAFIDHACPTMCLRVRYVRAVRAGTRVRAARWVTGLRTEWCIAVEPRRTGSHGNRTGGDPYTSHHCASWQGAGELLEYRRHRALNASITIIIEMRQNYARPCAPRYLRAAAGQLAAPSRTGFKV